MEPPRFVSRFAPQEPGITGAVGAVEFEAEAAVDLGSEWLGLAVTHRKSLS
jgi:hypothetical protein